MNTIVKKYVMKQKLGNSERGKIVRLLLLSQATNAKTNGISSALKHVKTYLRSTMGKQ